MSALAIVLIVIGAVLLIGLLSLALQRQRVKKVDEKRIVAEELRQEARLGGERAEQEAKQARRRREEAEEWMRQAERERTKGEESEQRAERDRVAAGQQAERAREIDPDQS